jgi:phage shock protein A
MITHHELNTRATRTAGRADLHVVELDEQRRYRRELGECQAAIHRARQTLAMFVADKFRLQRELLAEEATLHEHQIAADWAEQVGDEPLHAALMRFVHEQRALIETCRTECHQLEIHESGLSKSLRAAIAQSASKPYGHLLRRAAENLQRAARRLNSHAQFIGNRINELDAWMVELRRSQRQFEQQIDRMLRERAVRPESLGSAGLRLVVDRGHEVA